MALPGKSPHPLTSYLPSLRRPASLSTPTPGPAHRPTPATAPSLAGLPRRERVEQAFADIPLTPHEQKAIRALLDAPDSTATELSTACGCQNAAWRTQMILLCQRRRRYFWPNGMASDITNGAIIGALTEYDSATLGFSPQPDILHILYEAVDAG